MCGNELNAMTLAIHTTSVCTLKCKRCGNCFPLYKKPLVADLDKTLKSVEKCFKVFQHIRELRFAGGEAFLYENIEALMRETAKYAKYIDYGIIVTNGTYIPKESIIHAMKDLPYRMIVRVDNYGRLSSKYDELIEILKDNEIEVDERTYYGDDQAFGGWLDLGDYSYKNYSEEELQNVFKSCHMLESGMTLYDDKLMDCCFAASGIFLGIIESNAHDVIDLSDDAKLTVDEIRNLVTKWKDQPFEACKYCNGYNPENGIRIPAAEQL